MAAFVSERAKEVIEFPNFLLTKFMEYFNNPYDKENNIHGIINLGSAESNICSDLISERFNREDVFKWTNEDQFYFNFSGISRFREELATFLTERFNAYEKLDPSNITVMTGCGCVLKTLAFAVAEQGDYILCPCPLYSAIETDFGQETGVKIYHIPLYSTPQGEATKPFQLTMHDVEKAYDEAIGKGLRVAGILIINPGNPLGTVYSRELVSEILQFGAKKKLHVIADEIYGLSVFDESTTFTSVLSIPNLPDPMRTHFIWGFSKDFGLSGLRCGVLHTKNKAITNLVMKDLSYYSAVPSIIQNTLSNIIADKEWLDNVYFPTNRQRMRDSRNYIARRLEANGIEVVPCQGSFFIWAGFRKIFHDCSFELEKSIFDSLLHFDGGGIYIVPGKEFFCAEAGWFRILFTMDKDLLEVGCDRIEKVVKGIKNGSINVGTIKDVTTDSIPEALVFETSSGATLEDLLSTVTKQIQSSDWLRENTSEKWMKENPGLAADWEEHIDGA